jgi:hypothetical protein
MREHEPEVRSGNDFVAFDFICSINGVSPRGDVRFVILEFGVECARGVALFPLDAAAATRSEQRGPSSQNNTKECVASASVHDVLLREARVFGRTGTDWGPAGQVNTVQCQPEAKKQVLRFRRGFGATVMHRGHSKRDR